MNHDLLNISLKQGKKFNTYQTKIKRDISNPNFTNKKSKKEGFVSSNSKNSNFLQNKEQIVTPNYDEEPFNMEQTTKLTNNANQKDLDELKQLQDRYNALIQQYTDIRKKIGKSSLDTISRVSPNNPYLNKTVRFNNGSICYVTNQGVVKGYPDGDIFDATAGNNGCPAKSPILDIDLDFSKYYAVGSVIPTTPPLVTGTTMVKGQSCGNEGNNVYVDKYLSGTIEPSYVGCFAASEQNDNMTFLGEKPELNSTSTLGTYTYSDCKEAAVSSGYQYFALQNVDYASSKGYCAVSNDLTNINSYGESLIPSKSIMLWSTNTANQPGNTCTLTNTGSLSVVDSSGKTIYATPSSTTTDSGYLGCYADKSSRAMENTSSGAYYSLEKCKELAKEKGFKYYAGQNAQKDSSVWCAGSNDLAVATKYGLATNCIDKDGTILGGGWSNSIYSMDPGSSYYLILGDDGNMCIHRGTDPNNDQGVIWCSETKDQQQNANSDMVSSKSKYGENWIKSDSVLASGDFVSSTKGDLVLKMEEDGNLVLYTYTMESNCKAMSDGNVGGGLNANAAYNIQQQSFPQNMGLYGYVDADSILKQYPESMVGFINDYQIYQNTDSVGNDITSLVTSDQNGCQTACNNNADCAAFVYQSSSQTCWLKNRSAYPRGDKQPNNNVILGVRQPGLMNSKSCSDKIVNIDTIQYDNYLKGQAMTSDTQCSAPLVSQSDQIEFDNIKSQLITLGNDIISKMENLYNEDNKINENLNTTGEQFKKDLEKYKVLNLKIKKELNLQDNNIEGMQNLNMNDINGMLSDSDLRVLQENYSYIMWSILAVGLLTITINTMKK